MPLLSKSFLFAAVLILSFASTAAHAGRDAEHFVGSLLQQAQAVLRDNSGGEAVRRDRLHQLVMQHLDARKTALFALGPYQRELDQATTDAYVAAFTDYITAVYEARLRTFRTFDFKVITSTDATPDSATVITQASPPPEVRSRGPVYIWLRIARAGGQYKIIDVNIAGIWVSMYQRDQFARQLSQNRGDLRALTHYLNSQAAQIKAGNATV